MAAPEVGARISVMSEKENIVLGGTVLSVSGTNFVMQPDTHEHEHATGQWPRNRQVLADDAANLVSYQES